jgi:hypothetical protein
MLFVMFVSSSEAEWLIEHQRSSNYVIFDIIAAQTNSRAFAPKSAVFEWSNAVARPRHGSVHHLQSLVMQALRQRELALALKD